MTGAGCSADRRSTVRRLGVGGLCFPAPPGEAVDRCELLVALERADAALAKLRLSTSTTADADHGRLLATSAEALDRLSPALRARAFGTPLGCFDTDDGVLAGDASDAIASRLFRHLIGLPHGKAFALVVDARSLREGLFLPHLNATLLPQEGRRVALRQGRSSLSIVRSDGETLTLPNGHILPVGFSSPLLRTEPCIGPFGLLNGVAEVRADQVSLGLADARECERAAGPLLEALAALERLWPTAAAALTRHVSSLIVLAPRDHARSHSPRSLCGSVALTVGEPLTVGDILCHEASHVRMHHFKAFDPLVVAADPEAEARGFESPWRPDPRPVDGLLLGVHAFLNVCGWYRRAAVHPAFPASSAARLHARQARNVRVAYARLQHHGAPTPLGSELMAVFADAVRELARPVEPMAFHRG